MPSTLHPPSNRIRSVSLLLAGTLAVSSVVIASPAIGQAPPAPVPFEDIYSPTGSPDRVVMTPTDDPATSQAVTWRTSTDVETPVAEIAPIEAGPTFKNYEGRSGRNEVIQVAGTIAGDVSESLHYPMRFHTATFEGLEPDTTYLYRVGDGSTGNRSNRSNWSEWFEFTTATTGASDFSFIYVGDAQNAVKEHVSRVFRQAFTDRPDAELFLSAGDLTDVADRDYEWGEWFHANQVTTGNINQLATPGNHEYFRDGASNNVLNAYWDTQFSFPDNGPKPGPGAIDDPDLWERLDRGNVHYVDYQDVRFVSLDSNGAQSLPAGARRDAWYQIQAEWLDEVLTDNPNTWTVVYFHHPIFSVSVGRNNAQQRDVWLPVLEAHDVDLVLQGHDHTYGRGQMVDSQRGGSQQVHDGTVYAVSVSGPKMYNVSGQVWGDNGAVIASTAQDTQLYQLIDVSAREIRYEARDATGAFHDGVLIRKQPNGNRTVTELRP